jgi:hypothetical protein
MDIRIQCLRVDAAEPQRIASFREAALGWRRTFDEDDQVILEPPKGSPEDGVAPDILFLKVPEGNWTVSITIPCQRRAALLAGLLGTYCQDGSDRTSGPVPMAMRLGSTRALRTASAGLEWGKTCPLMLFQQSAEFGVLRSEGSLCVVHTAMVILTMTPLQPPVRQAACGIEPWAGRQ